MRSLPGDELGIDSKFRSHAGSIANGIVSSIDSHDTISANALREIFVRSPNADFLNARRPYHDAHRPQSVLEWLELCEERRLDALAHFVSTPELVAKRLDNVIGGNAGMVGSVGNHSQDGVKDAGHGTEPSGFTTLGAAEP